MSLTFDRATHTYKFDGRVVPSVTQLLGRLHSFAHVPEAVLEQARVRGTFVHSMCDAHDAGDLDEGRLLDEHRGYLVAWKAFRATYEPTWAAIEERGYSTLYAFAGTLDRRGVLGRIYPGQKAIVDIKTGPAHPVFGLQLAAYRHLASLREPDCALARRLTVQLQPDGRFKVVEWSSPDDWSTFLALIKLTRWSTAHGL